LSPATIAKTLEEQIYGTDLVLGREERYGLGWALNTDKLPYPTPNVAYWGGAGGSSLTMDLDHKMSIAYVMNQMQNPTRDEIKNNRFKNDSRANNLVEKVYEILQD
jgi:CubicO group peptidase (beta-lactamase class C family)